MNVALSPAQRRFVQTRLESGNYLDAGEVIRDALRLLEAQTASARDDIGTVASLVMMEAAKSAREDLEAIVEEVKAINAAKRNMRTLINQMKRDLSTNCGRGDGRGAMDFSRGLGSERAYHRVPIPCPDPEASGGVRYEATDTHRGRITRADEIRTIIDEMESRLDTLSEMGEMESLRLQMAMDRLSKAMSTLSNLLRKISETAGTIILNMK